MDQSKQTKILPLKSMRQTEKFEIEINSVPIIWDPKQGGLSFFGLDSALFWTDPSLVHMLAPLAEEIGFGLFRLLIAHSSSLGTGEDYHDMVSILGKNFPEGFLAWGEAVSGAGWGTFELSDYNPVIQQATVRINNPWELSMQRNLPLEKRWGCPFLQGKIIGIFSHAFSTNCWAEDEWHYHSDSPYVIFRIKPSSTTIQEEVQKLRKKRMLFRERVLKEDVERKTAELKKAQTALEEHSRSLERKVAERTSELNDLIEESPIAIFTTTPDGRILRYNKVMLSYWGLSACEKSKLKTVRLRDYYVNPEDRDELANEVLENGRVFKKEVRFKFPNGDGWLQLSMRKVEKANDTVEFEGFALDVTTEKKALEDLKKSQERLEFEAYHDPLTGLSNRSLLEDRIKQSIYYAMRSKRIVAVLLLDLDRFKRINDTLGHSAGDQLLMEVSRRLSNSVRECDTVARFGGDEFVIVLSEIAEWDDISIVTEKILETLSHPIKINQRYHEVDTSIGISCFPKDGQDAESLIQKADLAMYQAKQAGGSRFQYFAPEMTERAKEMLNLEAGLREGLKKKEFVLHYQPKFEAHSGRILGCEALVRWQHPQNGLLPPGEFISVAEETGLILPLGRWVLEEACRQANKWKAAGTPCKISVNVSGHQFQKEDFVQQVCDVLVETGADPELISLEITESTVMHDIPGAAKIMEQLKNLGLGLQLDDFGTGFSNFNSLRKFKVDCLKIDKSFVADALKESSAAAVIHSIIDIAHNHGLTAVAEGVETQEQLNFLAEGGCDAFQGFLFSKPLPAEELTDLIRLTAEKGWSLFNWRK